LGNENGTWGYIINHPELKLVSLTQEMGVIEAAPGHKINYDSLPIGSTLRIIPHHSCLSSACYSEYFIIKGDTVLDNWQTCSHLGW